MSIFFSHFVYNYIVTQIIVFTEETVAPRCLFL